MRLRLCICTLLAMQPLALCSGASGTTDEQLLDLVLQGTRHSYQSIESGRGSVEVACWNRGAGTTALHLQVVFSDGRLRVSEEVQGSAEGREIWYDGTNTTKWIKGVSISPSVRVTPGRSCAVVALFDKYVSPWGLAECPALEHPGIIKRESLDGRDCVMLEMAPASIEGCEVRARFWVDLDRGFTVPKMDVSAKETASGKLVNRCVVDNTMQQSSDDVWRCSERRLVVYGPDDTKIEEALVTYGTDFAVNVPVSDEELTPDLPPGTEVWDGALNMEYRVP